MQLNVSDIQHFSTGDGPGIRTTVFLKGCPLHCPWCHNPETISAAPQTMVYPSCTVHYGKRTDAAAVAKEIAEDRDFYASDGGATVSGGEPMLQAAALEELCEILHNDGISVIVDTAGDVPWESFERLLPWVSCWYFDCKTADINAYCDIIGGNGARIFDNLRRLIEHGASVQVRIPLIPGFNTSPHDIEAIIRTLCDLGVKTVDLLPFHRMAEGKYRALGLSYAYSGIQPLKPQEIRTIEQQYRTAFSVTVEA